MFITVQNLVGIDAAVSIIRKFWYLTALAWKCVLLPQNGDLGVSHPLHCLHGKQPHQDHQKSHPCAGTHHTTYRSLRSIHLFMHSSPFSNPKILRFTMLYNRSDTPKVPRPVGASPSPSNTRFPGPTQLSIPNCIWIGSAVFAQLTAESPFTLQWATTFPP